MVNTRMRENLYVAENNSVMCIFSKIRDLHSQQRLCGDGVLSRKYRNLSTPDRN